MEFLHQRHELPSAYLKRALSLTENYCDERRRRGDYQRLVDYRNAKSEDHAYFNDAKGKMGEFTIAHFLAGRGWPLLDPDTEVYAGKQKSWGADLPYGRLLTGKPDVAVKTSQYTSQKGLGASWTVQLHNVEGGGGLDRLLTPEGMGEWMALVVAPQRWFQNEYLVVAVEQWRDLFPYLADPELPQHRGRSICLYEEHLKGPRPVRIQRMERASGFWGPLYGRRDQQRKEERP